MKIYSLKLPLENMFQGLGCWRGYPILIEICIDDSLEKTLILGKIEGRRRRGWQRMVGWLDGITD